MKRLRRSVTLGGLLEDVLTARPAGSGATLAVLEHDLAAGEMPPLHVDPRDEAYRVLEGRLLVYTSDTATRLAAGDSFVVPRAVPHTVRADSARARFVTMTYTDSPSGYEAFARAVAPADTPALPEDAPLLRALGAAAGITVLGPPGSLPARTIAA